MTAPDVQAAKERAERGSRRESILGMIADVDQWLDDDVAERYLREPLGQDWARVAKIIEEAGEAIAALISWTGQNPRKCQRDEARDELLDELADSALTAIYGMQHFVKDADATMWLVWRRLAYHHKRMAESRARAALSAADNQEQR